MTQDEMEQKIAQLETALAALRREAINWSFWTRFCRGASLMFFVPGAALLLGVALSRYPTSALAAAFAVLGMMLLMLAFWFGAGTALVRLGMRRR